MSTTYRVVLKGPMPGQAIDRVAQEISGLFKLTVDQTRALLAKPGVTIKRGTDSQTAAKYQAALEQRGCVCVVEPEVSQQQVFSIDPAAFQTPSQQSPPTPSGLAASTNAEGSGVSAARLGQGASPVASAPAPVTGLTPTQVIEGALPAVGSHPGKGASTLGKVGGIIGIIAGVFGFLAAVITLAMGGLGAAFGAHGAKTVVGLGWGGVLFSFLAICFGAVALARPRGAGIGLIAVSLLGAILGGTLVAVCMALSLVGGILACIGGNKGVAAPASAPRQSATRSGEDQPSTPAAGEHPRQEKKVPRRIPGWRPLAIGAAALLAVGIAAAVVVPKKFMSTVDQDPNKTSRTPDAGAHTQSRSPSPPAVAETEPPPSPPEMRVFYEKGGVDTTFKNGDRTTFNTLNGNPWRNDYLTKEEATILSTNWLVEDRYLIVPATVPYTEKGEPFAKTTTCQGECKWAVLRLSGDSGQYMGTAYSLLWDARTVLDRKVFRVHISQTLSTTGYHVVVPLFAAMVEKDKRLVYSKEHTLTDKRNVILIEQVRLYEDKLKELNDDKYSFGLELSRHDFYGAGVSFLQLASLYKAVGADEELGQLRARLAPYVAPDFAQWLNQVDRDVLGLAELQRRLDEDQIQGSKKIAEIWAQDRVVRQERHEQAQTSEQRPPRDSANLKQNIPTEYQNEYCARAIASCYEKRGAMVQICLDAKRQVLGCE